MGEPPPGKLLTFVVPCFNSEDYVARCLDSLPTGDGDVEVLVVDDGSTDGTASIVDSYAARLAGTVRVIHQPNGGHGAAINTGVRQAAGRYLKIVDSDDWLDGNGCLAVLAMLRRLVADRQDVDALVSNFVYEKVGKRRKTAVRYRGVLPTGRVFAWDEVGEFGRKQYILMHSLIYRVELLRECGLRLPEHTFYVDNLYAYVPLARVRRLFYLDVDLYRYYIGRPDQSVNEAVMLRRVYQYLRITRMMVTHLGRAWADPAVPPALSRYLLHYAEIVCAASSVLLTRAGTATARADKDRFWASLHDENPWLYRRLRRGALGRLSNLPGRPGRGISLLAYRATKRVVGFS